MKKEEIKAKVVEIINMVLVEREVVEDIQNTENLHVLLDINSIEAIEIIVRIENEFDIGIEDEDLSVAFFSSLDFVADYIINRMNNK